MRSMPPVLRPYRIHRAVASQIKLALSCLIAVTIAGGVVASSIANAEGAFAVGRSEFSSWGSGVRDFPTSGEAQSEALRRCNRHGVGCRVVATFAQACFSLAVQSGTNGYGWTIRPTVVEARAVVLNECLAHGKPCEMKVAMCDGGQVRGIPADVRPPLTPSSKLVSPAETSQSPSRGCERYPELCP
jgi:Domain of unknown function (DUF4189)